MTQEIKFNFVNCPSRRNQGSEKWVEMLEHNPNVGKDTVPMSVADMEFEADPKIYQGLIDFLKEKPVLGYTYAYQDYKDAVINWQKTEHNFDIKSDWIVSTPGVVNAFTAAIKAFSKEGQGVIINKPVYYPMPIAIHNTKRKEINVPLINNNGYYHFDFEGFEKACRDNNNKIFLFCSPHNPTGRVWKKEELERIGKICLENDITIISDEIWNDIIMPGYEHYVLANLSDEIREITLTCTAASKTFNLAGLATSNIIVPNHDMRKKFKKELWRMRSSAVNILGYKATEVAYNNSKDWKNEMIKVVASNREICKNFFESRGFKVTDSESTFLVWVDFSSINLDKNRLEKFLRDAEIYTDEGYIFGDEGIGYERFNIGLGQEQLIKQLKRLDEALKKLNNRRS